MGNICGTESIQTQIENIERSEYNKFADSYIAEVLKVGELNELPYVTKFKHLLILIACPPKCTYSTEDADYLHEHYAHGVCCYTFLPNDKETRYATFVYPYEKTHTILKKYHEMYTTLCIKSSEVANANCFKLNAILLERINNGIDYLNGDLTKRIAQNRDKYKETGVISLVHDVEKMHENMEYWRKCITKRNPNCRTVNEILQLLNQLKEKLVVTQTNETNETNEKIIEQPTTISVTQCQVISQPTPIAQAFVVENK